MQRSGCRSSLLTQSKVWDPELRLEGASKPLKLEQDLQMTALVWWGLSFGFPLLVFFFFFSDTINELLEAGCLQVQAVVDALE